MIDPKYTEYQLMDGTIIGGTCELELVEAMARMKFRKPQGRASYRRATARRSEQMYGMIIDPATDETFIESLMSADLLREI